MGFCLLNNIALGASHLMHRYHMKRILIVDIDAHHGNGTQKAFYDTSKVLYVSLHQYPDYPGTGHFGEVGEGEGEGYNVNVPLAGSLGDMEYTQILYPLLNSLAAAYLPEMLLVSCGFDLYIHDRLGKMKITPDGYGLISQLLVDIANRYCSGRIVFVMEGGYSLKGIRECGLSIMKVLCGMATPNEILLRSAENMNIGSSSFLKKVLEIHKHYWQTLG